MSETTTNMPNDGKLFEIEKAEYISFKTIYHGGSYKHLRYGQAFCNHFGLHKSQAIKDIMDKLYELDGVEAKEFVSNNFLIR